MKLLVVTTACGWKGETMVLIEYMSCEGDRQVIGVAEDTGTAEKYIRNEARRLEISHVGGVAYYYFRTHYGREEYYKVSPAKVL